MIKDSWSNFIDSLKNKDVPDTSTIEGILKRLNQIDDIYNSVPKEEKETLMKEYKFLLDKGNEIRKEQG